MSRISSTHNVEVKQQHASICTYLRDSWLDRSLVYLIELAQDKGGDCGSLRDSEGTRRSDNEAHLSTMIKRLWQRET